MKSDDDQNGAAVMTVAAVCPASITDRHAFAGRDSQISNICQRWELRQGPLQIAGGPGIGKTALAKALASTIAGHFVDVTGYDASQITNLARDQDCPVILDNFDAAEHPMATFARLEEQKTNFIISARQVYLSEEDVIRLGPLEVEDAIGMLAPAVPETEPGQLETLVRKLDCIPGAVVLALVRLAEISLPQLEAEVDYGLFGEALDPDEWGLSLAPMAEPTREALIACAAFDQTIDLAAYEAIAPGDSGDSGEVLERLWRSSLLERTGPATFRMTWPVREAVRNQIQRDHESQLNVAHYFVDRSERTFESRGEVTNHDVSALERAFELGLIHDAELAARAAIQIVEALYFSGHVEQLIHFLELTLSRRQRMAGDQLTIRLMVLLATFERRRSNLTRCLELLHRALLLEPSQESGLLGRTYREFGFVYDGLDQFELAIQAYDEAIRVYEHLGRQDELSVVKTLRGVVTWTLGNHEEALDVITRVLDTNPTPYHRYTYGWMSAHFGHHEQARRALSRCIASIEIGPESSEFKRLHAGIPLVAHSQLMGLDILDGDAAGAKSRADAMDAMRAGRPPSPYCLVSNILLHLRFGELKDAFVAVNRLMDSGAGIAEWEARLLYDAISALLERPNDPPTPHEPSRRAYYAGRLAHRDLCVEFVSARHSGDFAELSAIRQRIDELLNDCRNVGTRILLSDLRSRVISALPAGSLLVIGPDLSWVRVGENHPVDLRRSKTASRLSMALVEHHEMQPGMVCSTEALFEAAWPGEAWSLSARTRFHTAIHRLRQRVLGDLLQTVDDGYCLSANLLIERDPRAWSQIDE